MRQAVKRLLADAVVSQQLTPIIASHNLRELEDICDHIGLLHQGGIIFERELDSLQSDIHKVQCAFPHLKKPRTLPDWRLSSWNNGAICPFWWYGATALLPRLA